MTDPTPEKPTPLTSSTVLDILATGEIKETHGLMRYSSNYTFLVTVDRDGRCLHAIYKPRKGERPLWDFPDGTLYKRERAAFLTAQALGWPVVPPTVVRAGEHGVGSLQLFIDHDPKQNYFSFGEPLTGQIARLSLFDVLINNADRKGGHCLLDANEQIWGIDHGLTFNVEHKLRTVIWDFAGQAVDAALLEDVRKLQTALNDPDSAYHKYMVDLINEEEMAAFRERIERTLADKCYPIPGPGPNYPWPAV